ncbi:glycosyltransferase family 2 protein [Saccharospirillum impatiens]|uniref:glycosyltransferase family 2 protein n=1 Tax=Saccharospirillum impatiens TaxID=169438 RepID=UPI00042944A1|nr:glycosyltransferase family 2 protein [Saccharospirillum impatiens]
MKASVVIRTYNEEKYLDRLLTGINNQKSERFEIETVVVDSGSTDKTLEIAKKHNCKITYINKEKFTFGRSLNVGCEFANGDFLVFVSGHCFPVYDNWIHELVAPLADRVCDYSYGRQLGAETTKFSEYQHFAKHFPEYSVLPQEGYFCNNANAAITRAAWERYKFDEDLTGLEDMHLAQKLISDCGQIGYVASAPVYHIHDESWRQVRTRYEREAYALQKIMPQMHFTVGDFFRYFTASLLTDASAAISDRVLLKKIGEIFMFRLMFYWGTYRGHHEVRQLSAKMKLKYFYPTHHERNTHERTKDSRTTSNESEQ